MRSMRYNLELFCRPRPFECGTLTLWSNAYIAGNVLKKHIDGSIDSGSRKSTTLDLSSLWIAEHSGIKADILDMGCGPGLYGNCLGKMIGSYTGIDISPYQIAYAKEHNSSSDNTRYHVCDFHKWQTKQQFDMILFMYAVYSFYPFEERISLLNNVKGALKPGGCVMIEVFTPEHYNRRKDSSDWQYIEKGGFWKPEPYIELNRFSRYRDDLILIQAGMISDNTVDIWNSWIELFQIQKIESELKSVGFTDFSYYGSCTGEEYTSSSEVLCVIAKL